MGRSNFIETGICAYKKIIFGVLSWLESMPKSVCVGEGGARACTQAVLYSFRVCFLEVCSHN